MKRLIAIILAAFVLVTAAESNLALAKGPLSRAKENGRGSRAAKRQSSDSAGAGGGDQSQAGGLKGRKGRKNSRSASSATPANNAGGQTRVPPAPQPEPLNVDE